VYNGPGCFDEHSSLKSRIMGHSCSQRSASGPNFFSWYLVFVMSCSENPDYLRWVDGKGCSLL